MSEREFLQQLVLLQADMLIGRATGAKADRWAARLRDLLQQRTASLSKRVMPATPPGEDD